MQAKGSDLRAHFKNTREAAFALKNMELVKAKKYLEDVIDHKRAIPFRRFCGGVGRTAQVGLLCSRTSFSVRCVKQTMQVSLLSLRIALKKRLCSRLNTLCLAAV